MSLKTGLATVVQTSSRFWAERNLREQRILLAGLAAILAALIYLLLVAPAQTGIARYNRSLPEARQQFATASFSALTEWLNEARAGFQLSVTEATVTAQPTPDIVNASLTLRQQKAQ